MKKIFYLIIWGLPLTGNTQQSALIQSNTNTILKLYGIGNLNSESLNNVNSSGKISLTITPFTWTNSTLSSYLSFNKNATNKDSLLASTLIFPEVGNHSFLGTIEFQKKISNNQTTGDHFWSTFFEFSQKNIKDEKDSANFKLPERHFSTLNYTLGAKYIFQFNRGGHGGSLSFTGYFSVLNIPDEDKEDYQYLMNNSQLTDLISSWGVKIVFQINNFQIFADMRNVMGSVNKVPIRDLRGFSSNIGVVFNAKIFEL